VIDYTEKEYAETTGSHAFTTNLKESSRHPEQSIFDLDFADDISLLEGGKADQRGTMARVQVIILANWGKRVGLEINIKKTEVFSNQDYISLISTNPSVY
jgi:hypothetical protein